MTPLYIQLLKNLLITVLLQKQRPHHALPKNKKERYAERYFCSAYLSFTISQ